MNCRVTIRRVLLSVCAVLLTLSTYQAWRPAGELSTALASVDVSVSVNQGVVTSYVPSALTMTVNWENNQDNGASALVNNIAVENQVHLAVLRPNAPSLNPSGFNGYLLVEHELPTMVLAGYQSRTEMNASLTVTGASQSNNDYQQVLFDDAAGSPTAGNRVDNSTSAKDLFGSTTPLCGQSGVVDGADFDEVLNGEFTFGGNSASSGGCYMQYLLDITQDLSGTNKQTDNLTFSLGAF